MVYNPRIHHRRSMRLRGFDYAQPGAYFVTANCKNRIHLFGKIVNGKMMLNSFGEIAQKEWLRTPNIRPNVSLGEFVIMPDHIHGIIIIEERAFSTSDNFKAQVQTRKDGAYCICSAQNKRVVADAIRHDSFIHPHSLIRPHSFIQSFLSPSQTLGAIIRGYMGTVTSQINSLRNTPGEFVWQRNYHDRIIWNNKAFDAISRYIRNNPKKWKRKI